jgi:hypothetical protein
VHVSPFVDRKFDYDGILAPPGQRLVAHIDAGPEKETWRDESLVAGSR